MGKVITTERHISKLKLSIACFKMEHSCARVCVLNISLLTDSADGSKVKVTMETQHSSVKMRAASQLPVIGPDDDLTGLLLQVRFYLSDITLISVVNCCNRFFFLFTLFFGQIFPLKTDARWHGPPPSQLSLALQQALAKELMRAKQGQVQQSSLAFHLLQAIAALLTSAHAGPIVMSMHHSHALSCPLMRQLHLYQVKAVAK